MQGYLSIVLHAHLPFVRHPEHENFLEEDWLYEAISETYLPLLGIFNRLVDEKVPGKVTMTLSPTLVSMLQDSLLIGRYSRVLDRQCELGDKEVHRTRNDSVFGSVARFYRDRFRSLRADFNDLYHRDLISAFKRLQDAGFLEIITCGATHGFLPLMQAHPEAVRAQISVAAAHYRDTFGRNPRGIWLPECGYYPGIETFLAKEDIRFFFTDTHGITHATPRPINGVHAPIYTPEGVAAFGRDGESSQQVWSSESGYPGDVAYREFYRDIGWDLDLDYLRPHLQATGERKNTGFKYFRITGKTLEKQPYDFKVADEKAAAHAGNFMFNRERQIEHLASKIHGRKPIVVAPYDAELYGHWWFEGPLFLDYLIRKTAYDQSVFCLATPVDYLQEYPENQICTPPMSSWGEKGYAGMWLNESNDWIYRHLNKIAQIMIDLARDFPAAQGIVKRALNQTARETLLAQSSDWAFIIKTGTMVNYAVNRTKEHVLRVVKLNDQIRSGQIDENWLSHVESKDNLFPNIDYGVYRPA